MVLIDVHEAKAHLSRLLERVEQGEEVVIARAGRPVARLVPWTSERALRVLGLHRGQVTVAPDFDRLPPDVAEGFEGGEQGDPAL